MNYALNDCQSRSGVQTHRNHAVRWLDQRTADRQHNDRLLRSHRNQKAATRTLRGWLIDQRTPLDATGVHRQGQRTASQSERNLRHSRRRMRSAQYISPSGGLLKISRSSHVVEPVIFKQHPMARTRNSRVTLHLHKLRHHVGRPTQNAVRQWVLSAARSTPKSCGRSKRRVPTGVSSISRLVSGPCSHHSWQLKHSHAGDKAGLDDEHAFR